MSLLKVSKIPSSTQQKALTEGKRIDSRCLVKTPKQLVEDDPVIDKVSGSRSHQSALRSPPLRSPSLPPSFNVSQEERRALPACTGSAEEALFLSELTLGALPEGGEGIGGGGWAAQRWQACATKAQLAGAGRGGEDKNTLVAS